MKFEKRGQIALFIIMGIVILGAFGFLFYASSVLQGVAGPDTSIPVSHTKQSSVEEYIQSVTADSFNECFALIGPQGGKIYDDQYGNSQYNPPSYINYPDHKPIGLGIKSGMVVGMHEGEPVPIYRARRGDTIVIEDTYTRNPGVGYIYGLNAPLPPMDVEGGPEAMETQLSDCTRKRFVIYFDKTLFENYAVYFLADEPVVDVSINLEDIGIKVYYPVRIETGERVVTTEDYYYTLNYRFGRLYRFIREIIRKDMYDRKVDIVNDLSNDDYVITREEAKNVDTRTGLKYDVIIVTDNTFEFNEEPYVFKFIRENRPPDANTVEFEPRPVYYPIMTEIVLWCPNYQTQGKLIDPDEDDIYANPFPFEPDWYDYSGYCNPPLYDFVCGNEISPFRQPVDPCNHVCCGGGRPMVVRITDYGEALDVKPFSGKIVQCTPRGQGCCNSGGCWAVNEVCGYDYAIDKAQKCNKCGECK